MPRLVRLHLHNDSAECHILGCGDLGWGLWPLNSNSGDIFGQCTYPPSFIILCLNIQKLSCWHKPKNEQSDNCIKHPPCFAMLYWWALTTDWPRKARLNVHPKRCDGNTRSQLNNWQLKLTSQGQRLPKENCYIQFTPPSTPPCHICYCHLTKSSTFIYCHIKHIHAVLKWLQYN